jgi:hypothetical protein
MARLARYLENLAVVLGETPSVHFARLESGSTVPVIKIEWEAVPKVRRRVTEVRNNEGPKDARLAKLAIERDLAEDNAEYGNLIDAQGARVIHFPGAKRVAEPEYGPFSQAGTLDGVPIVIGGENDPVPVHLRDRKRVYNCHASREVAKRLAEHLFTTPVRATGVGRWFRASDGSWEMRKFIIENFRELRTGSVSDVTASLQSLDAEWKRQSNPLGALVSLRDSEE